MFFGGVLLGVPLLCALSCMAIIILAACLNTYLTWGLLSQNIIAAERPASRSTPGVLTEPMATVAALATEVAAFSQRPAAPAPTPSAPPVSELPTLPDPATHPMAEYTIEGLRGRSYPGGMIQVRSVLTTTNAYTRYYIDYPSDELTITGIMQVPHGAGPFPVIILNHGYVPRERYWSGADTWSAAGYLNQRGYLTIAPDFRSWGDSDTANSFFSTGQVIDVLNLISSLSSVPAADPERVGMWGHSMGGGVTTKGITIDPRIKAAVLYAPVSADDAQVLARWGTGCRGGQSGESVDECAGAEVLTNDIDDRLHLAYRHAVSDPHFLYQVSPINHFDWVVAPVQIHIGIEDTTTPPEWSAAIHQALLEAGKEVEYFAYPGQGHSFEGGQWRLLMQRTADFFDRYLSRGS
jgi:dienelactone hydrolase